MSDIKVKEKIKAYIEILRPGWWLACFFIGLTPGMLAIHWRYGSLDEFYQFKSVMWSIAYWITVVGMYVYNDLVGKEEDAINNPNRPIPAGIISQMEASVYSIILVGIGVALFWVTFLDPLASLLQLACIVFIVIHSQIFKANIFLGLGAAFIPLSIWMALADFSWIMVTLAFLVFFWELTLDVPENILHYEGDLKAHPHTMAILIGREKLAKIGIYFAAAAIASSLWLVYLLDFSIIYLAFAVISGAILLNGMNSIRDTIQPMMHGKALGITMLFILLNNIGLMLYTIF